MEIEILQLINNLIWCAKVIDGWAGWSKKREEARIAAEKQTEASNRQL